MKGEAAVCPIRSQISESTFWKSIQEETPWAIATGPSW